MRYDIEIVMTHRYLMAVEGTDPMDAQTKATQMIGDRPPDETKMFVNVEKGADLGAR